MHAVQQKIPCVYVTGVSQEPTSKRKHQPFKVSALDQLTGSAQNDDLGAALATEKLDGTCCLVDVFEGEPRLWARHDRKPSKAGERKLAQWKKAQTARGEAVVEGCQWNFEKDFKEVPPNWIPATGLEVQDGKVLPDTIGHTPGWVPVEATSRQHCWHLQAVRLDQGLALVLRISEDDSNQLLLTSEYLSSLCGRTFELIGTNVNGNPYALGNKKHPLHFLVGHGSIPVRCPPPSDFSKMQNWMAGEEPEAQVEGIVWHCASGSLHKVHRHHLNQKWPVASPRLCRLCVKVQMDPAETDGDKTSSDLFSKLTSLNGQVFTSLKAMQEALETDIEQKGEEDVS